MLEVDLSVEKTDGRDSSLSISDSCRCFIQNNGGPDRKASRNAACYACDGINRSNAQEVEQSKEPGPLGSGQKQEHFLIKVIEYGGKEWVLSGWDYTYGKRMSQKTWFCPEGKMSAIVIVREKFGYTFLVQSPDGEVLDVGVCRKRHNSKFLSQKVMDEFLGHCEISLAKASKPFQQWLL